MRHLVRLVFVPVLRSGLGVRLHVQVPSVQLDNVSVLDMREDLCDGFISVALRGERTTHYHLLTAAVALWDVKSQKI